MQNFKTKHLQRGFTLIELLVVITIIGILATLLLSNFLGIRQRARDGNRKSNLYQIQNALEIYRADQGKYPLGSGSANTVLGNCSSAFGYAPSCTSIYMQKIPIDPTGESYTYQSDDGISYTLVACLENGADSQTDVNQGGANKVPPCVATRFSFTLINP